MSTYRNPIIPGFNPDPSIIRVEEVYYLVTSSFLYFPGLPIYSSLDLINWTQIGNVVSRPSQLPRLPECALAAGSAGLFSGGLWAPTIRYNEQKQTFFVTCTLVFPDTAFEDPKRWQNLVFETKDLTNWSDPVLFDYPGYDTSLSWDDKGVAHVQGSFYYRIRPEISQIVLDTSTGESLSGEPKKIWSGEGGKAPEAPHAYFRGGWWWLLIAEGGTELGHRATMARARTLWGPWTSHPANPVLTSAHLPSGLTENSDPLASTYFTTIGHADLVETPEGEWFAVALATRDGLKNFPMGRETVMVPVEWPEKDGEVAWPTFGTVASTNTAKLPAPKWTEATTGLRLIEEGTEEDLLVLSDIEEQKFALSLLFLRLPDFPSYRLEGGDIPSLVLKASPSTLADQSLQNGTTTFIGRRQTDLEGSMVATFDVATAATAGLTAYLDRTRYFAFGISPSSSSILLDSTASSSTGVPYSAAGLVSLRIDWTVETYSFSFKTAEDGAEWQKVGEGKSSDVSGGFTGVILGVWAQGAHEEEVRVTDWKYKSIRKW